MATLQALAEAADPLRQKINEHGDRSRRPLVVGLACLCLLAPAFGGDGRNIFLGRGHCSLWEDGQEILRDLATILDLGGGLEAPFCHLLAEWDGIVYLNSWASVHLPV